MKNQLVRPFGLLVLVGLVALLVGFAGSVTAWAQDTVPVPIPSKSMKVTIDRESVMLQVIVVGTGKDRIVAGARIRYSVTVEDAQGKIVEAGGTSVLQAQFRQRGSVTFQNIPNDETPFKSPWGPRESASTTETFDVSMAVDILQLIDAIKSAENNGTPDDKTDDKMFTSQALLAEKAKPGEGPDLNKLQTTAFGGLHVVLNAQAKDETGVANAKEVEATFDPRPSATSFPVVEVGE